MGLSNATFGLVSGFIVLPLPQLLAKAGVPETRIAAVSAACLFPGFWVFLLGPVLDVRFSRRGWATFFAGVAGVGLAVGVLLRARLELLEAALVVAYAAAALSSNALGGWLAGVVAVMEPQQPTVAASMSAWTQVGLFLGNGGMALAAGEGMRLLPLGVVAPLLGALVVVPAAVFPWIPVPESEDVSARRLARESFTAFFGEVWALVRRREVLVTLLLFVVPTGSFALTNSLGGLAGQFHASDAFASRIGGAVLTVAGAGSCLLLPVLSRRVRPLPLYLLIGTVGSVFTLLLLALPRTPVTFAIAFLGENMVQALSFTAAVAICFAVIGKDNPLAGTHFGLLTAGTVLPIVYMGVLDGRVFDSHTAVHGLAGMYWVDGGLSLLACGVMALVLRRWPVTSATP